MSERSCDYSSRDGKHYGADRDPRTVAANDWNREFEGPEIDYEKTSDQMSANVQAEREFGVENDFQGGEF